MRIERSDGADHAFEHLRAELPFAPCRFEAGAQLPEAALQLPDGERRDDERKRGGDEGQPRDPRRRRLFHVDALPAQVLLLAPHLFEKAVELQGQIAEAREAIERIAARVFRYVQVIVERLAEGAPLRLLRERQTVEGRQQIFHFVARVAQLFLKRNDDVALLVVPRQLLLARARFSIERAQGVAQLQQITDLERLPALTGLHILTDRAQLVLTQPTQPRHQPDEQHETDEQHRQQRLNLAPARQVPRTNRRHRLGVRAVLCRRALFRQAAIDHTPALLPFAVWLLFVSHKKTVTGVDRQVTS